MGRRSRAVPLGGEGRASVEGSPGPSASPLVSVPLVATPGRGKSHRPQKPTCYYISQRSVRKRRGRAATLLPASSVRALLIQKVSPPGFLLPCLSKPRRG